MKSAEGFSTNQIITNTIKLSEYKQEFRGSGGAGVREVESVI